MTNVKTEFKGKLLVVTIDTSERHGQSKSGKTTIIASTHGAESIILPGKEVVSLNLNLYTK